MAGRPIHPDGRVLADHGLPQGPHRDYSRLLHGVLQRQARIADRSRAAGDRPSCAAYDLTKSNYLAAVLGMLWDSGAAAVIRLQLDLLGNARRRYRPFLRSFVAISEAALVSPMAVVSSRRR